MPHNMIPILIILANTALCGGTIVTPKSHTYRNAGLDNKLFTENVVFESAVTHDVQCARLCSQHDACQSFTLTSTVCRGHSLLVTSNSSSSVDAPGAQTFELDECASGPCQNRGSCVDQVNAYTCNCQAGYTGINCQTELPVLHGSCTTDNDCGTKMGCFSGECLCGDGYFYSHSQSACVQACSQYHGTYLHYENWDMQGHDSGEYQNSDANNCAQRCNQDTSCLLYGIWKQTCYLKTATAQDYPADWMQTTGVNIYQRTCI